MPRWPVDVPRATPHGKWGQVRASKADGGCGSKGYPCTHNGLDLAGGPGTEVYAPEDATVVLVSTGVIPPWSGYRPGHLIVLRGKRTNTWHVLAHLLPGSIVSPTVDGSWWDWATTPLWKSDDQPREVREGEIVGRMGDANHVHWETRTSEHGARNNPALWVKRYVSPSVNVSAYSTDGDAGGGGLLLLAALYLYSERKR